MCINSKVNGTNWGLYPELSVGVGRSLGVEEKGGV